MGFVDENEGMSVHESVTHLEKFNAMRVTYPHLYIHYKIFAHALDMGKGLSRPKNKNLLIEFVTGQKQPEGDQEFLSALAVHFETLVKDKIKNIAVNAINEAKDGKEIDHKSVTNQMLKEGLEILKNSFNAFLLDVLRDDDSLKKIGDILESYEPQLESFVTKIRDNGTKSVNGWENKKGKLAKGRIQQESIRQKISDAFELQYDVWESETSINTIHDFTNKLQRGGYDKPKDPEVDPLDRVVLGKVTDVLPAAEDYKLAFLKQFSPVEVPKNLEHFSAPFLFELAKYLQEVNQVEDALNVINTLLKSRESYKYKNKNEILHIRAILLSHDQIKKWDDAIDILLDLYMASRYHFIKPEVLTLLASNYKRKAFYEDEGSLKDPEDVDLDLVAQALSLYKEAYQLKEEQEKYYDAINIAYLTLILHHLEEQSEYKKSFNEIKEEVARLHRDLLKFWRIESDDWWAMSTSLEFYLLKGDEVGSEMAFNQIPPPTAFELDVIQRQLTIYTHFCPHDTLVKEFVQGALSAI